MRNIFLAFLFLVLAIRPVFADEFPLTITPTAAVSSQQVTYALPYPGILPNSPFYIFKAIRDKLVSLIISNPEKKAEFDLLQADKRLAAAMYLLQDNNQYESLALETLGKGDNYFFYGVQSVTVAKKQGQNVNGLLDTMLQADLKHEEIMQSFEVSRDKAFQRSIQIEEQRLKGIAADITSLKQK